MCKFALSDNILDGIKAVLFAVVYYGNEILNKSSNKDENHTNN